MIWFLIILLIVVALIFFIPIKFTIYANIKGKNVYCVENHKTKNKVIFSLKILGIIPIYIYDKEKRENKGKNSNVSISKIFNAIKNSVTEEEFKITNITKKIISWCSKVNFKKLILVVGFNTEDYVKNSYINASLNSIICMIVNANQERFDFNNRCYQVGISDYSYYLVADTVITFSLYNNIDVFMTIIKFILTLKKESGEENNVPINVLKLGRNVN